MIHDSKHESTDVPSVAAASTATASAYTRPGDLAPGMTKPRSLTPVMLAVGALVLASGAGFMWLQKSRAAAEVSPLEPTAAVLSVPVPASAAEKAALAAVAKPDADPSPNALVSAAVTAANSGSSVVAAVTDTFASLRNSLNNLTGRVDVLEASDRDKNEKIAGLRSDVDRIGSSQVATAAGAAAPTVATVATNSSAKVAPAAIDAPRAKPAVRVHRTASVSHNGARTRVARAAPAPVTPPVTTDASVLAVDMWGGRPSVAVGKTGATGMELRFLNEGESNGSVTLKRADVGSQRATFNTPGGELTLAPKEQ